MEIFNQFINKTNTCWLWMGKLNRDGYALYKGKLVQRIWFRYHKEGLVGNLVIDHLCRVRHCLNPDHLEAVTIGENIRRGIGARVAKERHQAVTHCPQGHEYSAENTYFNNWDGYTHRTCKTCTKNRRKRDYLASKTT